MRHGLQAALFLAMLCGAPAALFMKQSKVAQDADEVELESPANQTGIYQAVAAAIPKIKRSPLFNAVHDSVDAVYSHYLHHHTDPSTDTNELMVAYGVAVAIMFVCVVGMFYPMGPAVIFQVILYVACLAFVKISLKKVYDHNFSYPHFITWVHSLASSLAGFAVLLHRWTTSDRPFVVPTRDEFLFRIIPIASMFGFSVATENSALVFVSVAFSEVVGSTSPVMSFVLMWALGMDVSWHLLVPIAVVVVGCLISVEGEMTFSPIGLVLLMLSIFFRGLKAILQQKLMTGARKEQYDPVTLMAWTCLIAFIMSFYISLLTEGFQPYLAIQMSADLGGLTAALIVSAGVACALNIAGLLVIRQLGAVGMQLVSHMKALLVVIGGMAVLGETFTDEQKVGFVIVLSGVSWYSRSASRSAKRQDAVVKGQQVAK